MKVFISQSGEISLKVATVFRDWLPSVIQSIEPYVSSEDIDKGARWSTDIAKELENSTFGILCVTKENLEAPWLSFEAGALSKTMDKSFVNPFLFNIKRSEVQGPILQFQSTIFEKEDIKRMVKTLNKACGDTGISDSRLETSFDVWYPRLEDALNQIKTDTETLVDAASDDDSQNSSEILEEILELSRDNQKLLRNPDPQVSSELEEIKEKIDQIFLRTSMSYDRKRMNRKHSSMLFEDIMHITRNRGSFGFLMILSLYKDEFPWIYDMGKEVLDILKSNQNTEDKAMAIREFREMIEFSFGHPIMREIVNNSKDGAMMMKEMSYTLMRCMDELFDQYSSDRI